VIDREHELPLCAPGDTVAVSGEPRDEIVDRYSRLGGDVTALVRVDPSTVDLIVLDQPAADELRAAETALRPGGTIVIRGTPAGEASLAGPDAVLSELRVEFFATDAH
jgi:threonine dehydrogenase-like Zn-dependent dehydrogenase